MYLYVHTSVCHTIHVIAMYSAQTSPVPVYMLSPFCVPDRCEDVRCTVERESMLVHLVRMLAGLAIQVERYPHGT